RIREIQRPLVLLATVRYRRRGLKINVAPPNSPARPLPHAPLVAPGSDRARLPAAAAASEAPQYSDPPDSTPEMSRASPAAWTCGDSGIESRSSSAPDPQSRADPSWRPGSRNAGDAAIRSQN